MHPNAIDITGQRFGKLVATRPAGSRNGYTEWTCMCDCGNVVNVRTTNLRSGNSQSCGCTARQATIKRNTTYGDTGTRLHQIWRSMKQRCYDPGNQAYARYGGRGIVMCEEWLEYHAFKAWALANGYSDNLSIDRIDVNGNYEPSNCRWADILTQANNKRNNRVITAHGKTMTLAQWSRHSGLALRTIQERLRRGWLEADAVTIPPLKKNQHTCRKGDGQ